MSPASVDRVGPTYATVVPFLNEADYIVDCVLSLVHQTVDPCLHMVLLLDGGSTDDSRKRVEDLIATLPPSSPRVEIHDNPGRTVSAARNLALTLLPASVEFLIEMIAHATVKPDSLQQRIDEWAIQSATLEQPLGALGCKVVAAPTTPTLQAKWIEATLSNPLGQSDGQFSRFQKRGPTLTPAFVMQKREAIQIIGGWDESLLTSQDSDVSMRLLHHGFALRRSPVPEVAMVKRHTLGAWWLMSHRYGFWRTKIVKKYPKRIKIREMLPWFGVLFTLTLLIFQVQWWYAPVLLYGFVLMAVGIHSSVNRREPSCLIGVPLCMLILHVGFSIGLLDGLIRKGKHPVDRVSNVSIHT